MARFCGPDCPLLPAIGLISGVGAERRGCEDWGAASPASPASATLPAPSVTATPKQTSGLHFPPIRGRKSLGCMNHDSRLPCCHLPQRPPAEYLTTSSSRLSFRLTPKHSLPFGYRCFAFCFPIAAALFKPFTSKLTSVYYHQHVVSFLPFLRSGRPQLAVEFRSCSASCLRPRSEQLA